MNNLVFVKTIENVRKYRDIKGVTTEVRRNYLLSEPNYNKYYFSENLLAIVMGKILVVLNKPVYLGLSISELSKIVKLVLVWLRETKIWRQSKIMLHG